MLVTKALRDGPESFAPIVERYQDAMFGAAMARLGDFHETQDTAQTLFIEALDRLGILREPAKLGEHDDLSEAWMRCISGARRRCPNPGRLMKRGGASCAKKCWPRWRIQARPSARR